ncbi:hypothetical protein KC343_g12562 [Hortaea werneckii]|nr:hypothetical protein KC317_g11083 [Hortaea werneckii]KAI7602604.1 hypothetical protein KC346_g12293 [Hortaea werneckii]KAI7608774.1 hypothetical protein KC343_g12562 [Hortaea werneckii]KAI7644688.1 hypothetical protein KC319_g12231 [Hortaea werneckii]KAI7692402.1 hypothetical protein KC322_g10854 [Hortaea werneckii]
MVPAKQAHAPEDAKPPKAASEPINANPITQDAFPAIKEPINSSGQRPSSAAAHNLMWQCKEHNRLHLLNLPHRLRLAIFRLVLVTPDRSPVEIRAERKELSAQPALLQTCHALCEIYRPVFYKENRFVVHVEQYGIHAVLPWLDRHGILAFTATGPSVLDAQPEEEFMVAVAPAASKSDRIWNVEQVDGDFWEKAVRILGQRWETLTTQAPTAPPSHARGDCIIRTDGVPNWMNLVSWLQLSHSRHVVALMRGGASGEEEGGEGGEAPPILAAFEMVMSLGDESWATVEKILPGIRSMLVAGDVRWGSLLALTVAGEDDDAMSAAVDGYVQSMAEMQHAAAIEDGPGASQTTREYFSPGADEKSPNREDHYLDEVLEAEDSEPDLPSHPQLQPPRAPIHYEYHPTLPSSSQQAPQRKASVRIPREDVEVMDLTQGAPAQIDLSNNDTEYEREGGRFAQGRKRRIAKNNTESDVKGSNVKKRKTLALIEDSDIE